MKNIASFLIVAQDYEAEGGTLVKIAPPAPRPAAN